MKNKPVHIWRWLRAPTVRRALSFVALLALLLAFVSASMPLAYAAGTVTVSTFNDVVDGNTSSITAFGGGGVLAGWTGDTTTLSNVSITGNTTSGGNQGGGIGYGGGGNLTITNSTISGNSSDLVGAGIAFNQSGNAGNLTITNST